MPFFVHLQCAQACQLSHMKNNGRVNHRAKNRKYCFVLDLKNGFIVSAYSSINTTLGSITFN
jgi:hypothetical protein